MYFKGVKKVRLKVVAGTRNHLNLLFNAPRLEAPLWWRGPATTFTEHKQHAGANPTTGGVLRAANELLGPHARRRVPRLDACWPSSPRERSGRRAPRTRRR